MAIGLRAAKQQLRQQLREALKGMTSQQRQEESLILVEKVRYLIMNILCHKSLVFVNKYIALSKSSLSTSHKNISLS